VSGSGNDRQQAQDLFESQRKTQRAGPFLQQKNQDDMILSRQNEILRTAPQSQDALLWR